MEEQLAVAVEFAVVPAPFGGDFEVLEVEVVVAARVGLGIRGSLASTVEPSSRALEVFLVGPGDLPERQTAALPCVAASFDFVSVSDSDDSAAAHEPLPLAVSVVAVVSQDRRGAFVPYCQPCWGS